MSLTVESREVDVAHYYPNTVAPSLEFKTLATIENIEFNTFWGRFWQLMANTFVYDANIIGIKRWEEMLSIFPTADETLDERRAAILAKLNATLPYTERRLQEMLNANYGEGAFTVKLDYNKYEIYLDSSISGYPYCAKAVKFTHVIIPANLVLYLMFIYSQKWRAKHKAEIMGYVNGSHNFWNLGNSGEFVYWEGIGNTWQNNGQTWGETPYVWDDGNTWQDTGTAWTDTSDLWEVYDVLANAPTPSCWDRSVRWDGKSPDPNYRESQPHSAQIWRLVSATQTRPYFAGDGNTWQDSGKTWEQTFFAWVDDIRPETMALHTATTQMIDIDGQAKGEIIDE